MGRRCTHDNSSDLFGSDRGWEAMRSRFTLHPAAILPKYEEIADTEKFAAPRSMVLAGYRPLVMRSKLENRVPATAAAKPRDD